MKDLFHFTFLNDDKLEWWETGRHRYTLKREQQNAHLSWRADIGAIGTQMGVESEDKKKLDASPLDHIIIDEFGRHKWLGACESLTLWTNDLEFNVLLFRGEDNQPATLRCAYFRSPTAMEANSHLRYWCNSYSSSVGGRSKRGIEPLLGLRNECADLLKGRPTVSAETRERDHRLLCLLPELVVWNLFVRPNPGGVVNGTLEFERDHCVARDVFRGELQTIPLPSRFLLEGDTSKKEPKELRDRAQWLYEKVLVRYAMYSGCGSAMKRNLLNLASLLVDGNIRNVLVTGEPGTGKEAICKALYYGGNARPTARRAYHPLRDPDQREHDCFVAMTARDLQDQVKRSGVDVSSILKEKVRGRNSPVIFIDELNKADKGLLAALLRPLEQGKDELETTTNPLFIFAASEHIDDLARTPPQDFWTRMSHQLRVVHPLSRVSEEDAAEFLRAFFYAHWWDHVRELVEKFSDDEDYQKRLVKVFLGDVKRKKFTASDHCKRVEEEFLNTLVPLVSRDTLPVRGARSMLSQVFGRLNWYVRFENPRALAPSSAVGPRVDDKTRNEVSRLVNSAVQDVMAILNAARSTPAAMAKRNPDK